MNLSKRVGLNINRRQNSSDKKHNSSFSSGGSGEGPGLPPYFLTKLRLEGPKKNCCETGSPPPLISGSGWPPRPRYLKVWIRHWLVSFSFLYAVIWPALYKFFDGHWNIRNCRSNFRDIFYFLPRKKLQEKLRFVVFSRWSSAKQLAKWGRCMLQRSKFWRETRKVLWFLIGSLTREKTSFAILIGRIIFSTRVKHWLEPICVRKFSVIKKVYF